MGLRRFPLSARERTGAFQMASKSNSSSGMAARERRFYTWMAWFLVAVVFIGFAPSFYLKPLGLSYPRPNPPLIPNLMLHGAVFTAWVEEMGRLKVAFTASFGTIAAE